MRRLLENALLLVAFLVFFAVVNRGWEQRADLSAWLGDGDSDLLDTLVGWATLGGLLAAVGLLPLRRGEPMSKPWKVVVAAPFVTWGALAATYLWTPLAGDRDEWLDDLAAGGQAFQAGVVAAHWALATSVLLVLVIGVAQVVSPRWQSGNAENERRSELAISGALVGPSLLALVVAWLL